MRKRICVLLLALLLLPRWSAQALDGEISASFSERGGLTVTLPSSPSQATLLVAAAYADSGQMTDIAVRTLDPGADTTQVFPSLAEADRYKAFALAAPAGDGAPAGGAPVFPSGPAAVNYTGLVAARGQVYVPAIGGVTAHAAAMAVDAYVEADTAREQALSFFAETGESIQEDGKNVPVTRLAQIAKTGSAGDKQRALAQIRRAASAAEQAVKAAAVLDAAAGQDARASLASMEEDLVRLQSAVSQEQAEKWAQELSDKWDALGPKNRLREFSRQLGIDARTAYQALSDAQSILNGKYTDEAKFYDVCTRVATGVKTASKVGVYVCATIATGGAASAAGGLTVAEAAGIVVGGVDAVIETERTGMKIILGDDHKVVQAVEERMQTYDTAMFLYGVATFNPEKVSTGEKLLFIQDLAEKNLDTYENVKVCIDEATGLVIDRIEGETEKIAVDYTRIQSEKKEDLAKAAEQALGKENTGIRGLDPALNGGTEKEQKEAFTKTADSGDAALSRAYSQAKTDDATLSETIAQFKADCDTEVAYQKISSSGEGGGGGGGGGGDSGDDGGGDDSPDIPPPEPDIDSVERVLDDEGHLIEEIYYDSLSYYDETTGSYNRPPIGGKTYLYDAETGTYWPVEEWYRSGGMRVVTEYYQKDRYCSEEEFLDQTLKADGPGLVHRRYVQKADESYTPTRWEDYYGDEVTYYPSGAIKNVARYADGNYAAISFREYSPEGNLYRCFTDYGADQYTYFVYPGEGYSDGSGGVEFDPTGHLKSHVHYEGTDLDYELKYEIYCKTEYSTVGGELTYMAYGYLVLRNNDEVGFIEVKRVK